MKSAYYADRLGSHAEKEAQEAMEKYAKIMAKWKETQAEIIYGPEGITQEIHESWHAWYYANEFGGYILCCDATNAEDGIEDFGDAFLSLAYKGLIHDPSEIEEEYLEDYYPYNGGEMYIDMPTVIEQIY